MRLSVVRVFGTDVSFTRWQPFLASEFSKRRHLCYATCGRTVFCPE